MRRLIVIAPLLCAVPLAAQQLGGTVPSERQPVIRTTLAAPGEPVRPAPGWSLRADADVAADAVVMGQGPGARITTPEDVTVFRRAWTLAGTFAVAATFQAESPSAIYGVTLGGERGLAFLLRSDGAVSVQPLGSGSGGTWSRVALRVAVDGAPVTTRLEIRVEPSTTTCVVDGQIVRVIPITAGQLDGVPGVHVGASGDVVVAGFTVQSASTLPPAGK